MIEVREVLRLRGAALTKKRIAAQLGLDLKTVRRYLRAAAAAGVSVTATIRDEDVRHVLLALQPAGGRPRGDGWALCGEHRAAIARWLGDRLRLAKVRKLFVRQGVHVAYPTNCRWVPRKHSPRLPVNGHPHHGPSRHSGARGDEIERSQDPQRVRSL